MARPKGIVNKKVEETKNETVLSNVAATSMDKVTQKLAAFSSSVQQALGDLTAKLADQFSTRDALDKAISLKTEELERLRQIEVTASTLDDLNASIDTAKAQHNDWLREANDNRIKEQNDYTYNLAQQRKRELDAYNDSVALKSKEWKNREEFLATQEAELERLKLEAAGYPEREKAAVKAALGEQKGILESHFKNEAKMRESEFKSQSQVLESAKSLAESRYQDILKQNEDLKNQIRDLTDKMSNLSASAFNAFAGQASLMAPRTVEVQNSNTKKGTA